MEADHTNHRLLMTGATGMVGSYVMAQCLRREIPIAVLVRGRAGRSASQRVDELLKRFEQAWSCKLPTPVVLEGQLLTPHLGLDEESIDWIRRHCDQVLHSAADLSFAPAATHANNEPFRTNVQGTRRLAEFCDRIGLHRFHHVSTAYVCGTRKGTVYEHECDVGQGFANDYERSKVEAETLLGESFAHGHLTIYRPSIVIDRSGLAPVSGDRTIYGAYSMYQMLASRFGLPERGEWFRSLGFHGNETKNLIDVPWIAQAIATVIESEQFHGGTYHLTARSGTPITELDQSFHQATEQWLASRRRRNPIGAESAPAGTFPAAKRDADDAERRKREIDQLAAPFVETFLPYFRDDPKFDHQQIDQVIDKTDLSPPPEIGSEELMQMIRSWAPASSTTVTMTAPSDLECQQAEAANEVAICGFAVRLPGGVNSSKEFERLLFAGRSAIERMPDDRLDRSLYFDSRRGLPGKTYTEIGGCVDTEPLDAQVDQQIQALGEFDLTHQQFAQVAVQAFRAAFAAASIAEVDLDDQRAGIFVGHSGGTQSGGPLAMAAMARSAASLLVETEIGKSLPVATTKTVVDSVTKQIRQGRPRPTSDGGPQLNAYSVASLAANLLGLQGRREVIDAACSSSIIALQHAMSAIEMGRLDMAIVGGATFNNVDNLALFSRSGACSDSGCHPFDSRASGLISSEGYVAVAIVRRSVAERLGLPIHAIARGVGVASDGKGKGLWAPRTEGQQLAMRRACADANRLQSLIKAPGTTNHGRELRPLELDYLECHATSTQVGDATELESLSSILCDRKSDELPSRLLIGSVKSNLGHLLEAAGLVGLIKCLIAMRSDQIPASIHFASPTDQFDWTDAPIKVVDQKRSWPPTKPDHPKRVGVNAFGIGGLNAHAIIEQPRQLRSGSVSVRRNSSDRDAKATSTPASASSSHVPVAIVGRGLHVPGASCLSEFARLLCSDHSEINEPPKGRWLAEPFEGSRLIGVGSSDDQFTVPHCRGGYIAGFKFDAQSYRIPPKLVQYANPAQLMLIEAVKRALKEFDSLRWTVDRQRVGVSIGSMFGGQFSNELQIGLRLPELCKHLDRAARAASIGSAERKEWVSQFESAVLNRYPALLDETGGFTASTQASAVSRVFDLMGGAFAVDADVASGGLAVLNAVERLSRNEVDLMICGATHRSMDLVALNQLYRKGQLVPSGQLKDLPKDGSQVFPGEGVATILLQRLDDAIEQKRPIFGVVNSIHENWAKAERQMHRLKSAATEPRQSAGSHEVACRIGHLGGAHGLVCTIAATIPEFGPLIENSKAIMSGSHESNPVGDSDTRSVEIVENAEDGYQISYRVSLSQRESDRSIIQPAPRSKASSSHTVFTRPDQRVSSSSPPPQVPVPSRRIELQSDHDLVNHDLVIRIETKTQADLVSALNDVISGNVSSGNVSSGDWSQVKGSVARFNCQDQVEFPYRAGIVANSLDELHATANALIDGPIANGHSSALTRLPGWVRLNNTGARTAWLFPGQGSQYAGAPDLLKHCPQARAFLARFDASLEKLGHPAVSHRLADPDQMLGRDIWWTQLWVLATGSMMTESLMQRGHRPDVVLGHSFGECTAAWSAGVMTLDQAILFAKHRSEAVVMHSGCDGLLLSVRSHPTAVAAVLKETEISYSITHQNAPQQTVIALASDQVASAKQLLSAAGYASVVIPVPAPFHTEQLRPAQELLAARFGEQSVLPPRCAFLSAISNRYLAEPRDIVNNLIEQLTRPVCFSNAIERVVGDDCGLLVEVGPSDVLTRLANATVDGKAICIASDVSGRKWTQQAALVDLAIESFETMDHGRSNPVSRFVSDKMTGSLGQHPQPKSSAPSKFSVVDVTRRRRKLETVTSPAQQVQTEERQDIEVHSVLPAQTSPQSNSSQQAAVAQPQAGLSSKSELARQFLHDLVVDLTGYDPQIIEFDADLEAELGIDSIKRAQLIGELAQWAELSIDLRSLRLGQFGTLNDIVALIPTADSTGIDEGSGSAAVHSVATTTAVATSAGSLQTSNPGSRSRFRRCRFAASHDH